MVLVGKLIWLHILIMTVPQHLYNWRMPMGFKLNLPESVDTTITSLEVSGITNYDLLNICSVYPNLTSVVLMNCNLKDPVPLLQPTNLKSLCLDNCKLTQIGCIALMSGLMELSIQNCFISDIEPLRNLTELRSLSIAGNRVRDISSVSTMKHLHHLDFQRNLVNDITPIGGLTNLITLLMDGNEIKDLSPSFGLLNLKHSDNAALRKLITKREMEAG